MSQVASVSKANRWNSLPESFWLGKFFKVMNEPLRMKQEFFLSAWSTFLQLCTLLNLPSSFRLLILRNPGYRTYLRWNHNARKGIPFRPPFYAELLCSVIDVLEALVDHENTPRDASKIDQRIRRSPFKRESPRELLIQGDLRTNRELWLILRYPVEGSDMVKTLREFPCLEPATFAKRPRSNRCISNNIVNTSTR